MKYRILALIGIASVIWLAGQRARAQDEVPAGAGAPAQADAAEAPAVKPKPHALKKKAKGNGTREKETEGTEAPDRFEADTVIKSQYKLRGEQLEVDPD